ncbi:MAG: hypothetical protein AB3N14_14885 [Flavobacteriaceae bacterium]
MSNSCEHSNPLSREGTTQVQRLLDALIPENVKLHELGTADWMAFAKDYASLLNYFKINDKEVPDGDWDNFFPEKDQIEETLGKYFDGTIEPHLALFIAFLKLLAYPQQSLNGLPKRHLDFYYGEVLQLSPNPFSPDTVHVIFELAKNAITELVAKESKLEAGKDGEGNNRKYSTEQDLVVNQAQVAAMRSIYEDSNNLLRYALRPDTKDGLEEPLEGDLSWSAFGDSSWPLANLELALAGEIFALRQGTRTITVNWDFDKALSYQGIIYASLTTEEGWTDEIAVSVSGSKKNQWQITIPEEEKPISSFNQEIHLKSINTALPVLKFRFADPSAYASAKTILVTKISVTVDVTGVTDLIVQNEIGLQLAEKPFMPFGPRPKKNSALTVENKEFVGKQIASYSFNFNWLNVPPNFTSHYSHYADAITAQRNDFLNNLDSYHWTYMEIVPIPLILTVEGSGDNSGETAEKATVEAQPTGPPADTMREEFKFAVTSPLHNGEYSSLMFDPNPQIDIADPTTTKKGGKITIRLAESFYHDLYNNVYVSIITSNPDGVNPEELPNEPYTPLVDSLTMDYTAKASITLDSNSIDSDELKFIHLNPFGSSIASTRLNLLPRYSNNHFYIGLSGANPRDNVSILFQVAEGSEDPLLSSFNPGEEIKWAVLVENDYWQDLNEEDIIQNTTNNNLRSGIIQFSLPRETSSTHFYLDDQLIWLKAELVKNPRAVARFLGVHTQATTAIFENNNNVFDHLNAGLPAEEIKQLVERKSKIKAVHQPYASFDGTDTESDNDFYRRASERLRHKDRALTIWDYEHLTLQSFTNIYKAKCLNHTRFKNNSVEELCPGHVTLVVVPKRTDSGTAQGLYPAVSQNAKDEIKAFLQPKYGLHVNLEVANPIYELIEFDLKVRFYPGKDYNFYRGQLEQDLIALLAPWAFDNEAEIKFNNALYSYDVINFIEHLEYVDFLEDFKMYHKPNEGAWELKNTIRPSSSMAVLAPKQSHSIVEAQNC